jgi:hypothetical protein
MSDHVKSVQREKVKTTGKAKNISHKERSKRAVVEAEVSTDTKSKGLAKKLSLC